MEFVYIIGLNNEITFASQIKKCEIINLSIEVLRMDSFEINDQVVLARQEIELIINNKYTLTDESQAEKLKQMLEEISQYYLSYSIDPVFRDIGKQIIDLTLGLYSGNKVGVTFKKEKSACLMTLIKLLEQACIRSKDGLVLISHSSKDKKYAEEVVQLLKNIGITTDKIICSSVAGTHIPLSDNIYEFLKNKFIGTGKRLYVICLFSENYFSSAPSLNEMGAAWVLSYSCSYFLLPDFKVSDIKGVTDKNDIMITLDNFDSNKHLANDFKNQLITFFNLKEPDATDWERDRDAFGIAITKK